MQVLFVDDHGRIGSGRRRLRGMHGVRLLPPAPNRLLAAVHPAPLLHDAALASQEPR